MKRLFALLLICLLPMQVFAGLLTYRTAVDTVTLQAQFDNLRQSADAVAADAESLPKALADDDSDDSADFADSEDFSNHAGVGDEPLRYKAQVFVVDSATLAPVLCSDPASPPPFLPPAGRPPRA
jgi:hypothetical protein